MRLTTGNAFGSNLSSGWVPLWPVASIATLTFSISTSDTAMSFTYPPLPVVVLRSMPRSELRIWSCSTSMLDIPPDISLPKARPEPEEDWRLTPRIWTYLVGTSYAIPYSSQPLLSAIASYPMLMLQFSMQTCSDESESHKHALVFHGICKPVLAHFWRKYKLTNQPGTMPLVYGDVGGAWAVILWMCTLLHFNIFKVSDYQTNWWLVVWYYSKFSSTCNMLHECSKQGGLRRLNLI